MKKMKSEDCGPGCDCGKPSGNKKAKTVVCLMVLLAICGIFVIKANSAKQTAQDNTTAAFAVPIINQAPAQEKVGEFLDSLASLNKVAVNNDTVFVFIPAKGTDIINKEARDAIASAEQKIKSKGTRIGLYTLKFSQSKEYADIAKQFLLPGILVMSKGRGMGAVSGEITETKLLQAYVASSRAGGCCPTGDGSSGGGSADCSPSAAPGPKK